MVLLLDVYQDEGIMRIVGGHLEMGELWLVGILVIGTPIHFIMFPGISIQCNKISFPIYRTY